MNDDMRRTLATPKPFEWRGKTYLIRPWENNFLAAYAAWVEVRAERRLKVKLETRAIDPAEYERQTRDLRRDADGGGYEWGSEIVTSSYMRLGSEGNKYLTLLTLQQADPTVTRELVEQFWKEDPKAWRYLWDMVLGPLNFPPDEPAPVKPAAGETPAASA